MKKIFSVLFMSLVLLVIPFGADSASAANGKGTYTVSYGQYTYQNNAYYVGVTGVYTGKITMNTYITVNEKGVTINKVTQSNEEVWPLVISNEGTSIIRKTSTNSKQKAISYANFNATLVSKFGPINGKDFELYTYFKVTKIDKAKKKVTYEVQNTDNNGW